MTTSPSNGKTVSKIELASLLSEQDKSLVAEDAIANKLSLMEARLQPMKDLLAVPLDQFPGCRPSIERLLPLLAQSVIDICYSILRRLTTHNPRSIYDIISSCERYGILPLTLVEPLARKLVLIDSDYNRLNDEEMNRLYRDIPRMYHTLKAFVREIRIVLQPPTDTPAESRAAEALPTTSVAVENPIVGNAPA